MLCYLSSEIHQEIEIIFITFIFFTHADINDKYQSDMNAVLFQFKT